MQQIYSLPGNSGEGVPIDACPTCLNSKSKKEQWSKLQRFSRSRFLSCEEDSDHQFCVECRAPAIEDGRGSLSCSVDPDHSRTR
jgi:hypothetical protein